MDFYKFGKHKALVFHLPSGTLFSVVSLWLKLQKLKVLFVSVVLLKSTLLIPKSLVLIDTADHNSILRLHFRSTQANWLFWGTQNALPFKVVYHSCQRYYFEFKIQGLKLIGVQYSIKTETISEIWF